MDDQNSKSEKCLGGSAGNPKSEYRNPKQIQISKSENAGAVSRNNGKRYDLEERTFQFAKAARIFIRQLPRTISNIEDLKQLARASGSIGANYIEANEAIGKRDFVMKIKTCRREAKESAYWVRLLDIGNISEAQREFLITEATELMKIFGSIIRKAERRI